MVYSMTYQVLLDAQGSRNHQMMELHTAGPPTCVYMYMQIGSQMVHNILYMSMYIYLSSGDLYKLESPIYMHLGTMYKASVPL